MKTQVNLKIDNDVKIQAQKKAGELGLSLSAIVNATLKQFSRTGELKLSTAPKITEYLENIVIEARQEFTKGETSGPFNTPQKLFKHLKI